MLKTIDLGFNRENSLSFIYSWLFRWGVGRGGRFIGRIEARKVDLTGRLTHSPLGLVFELNLSKLTANQKKSIHTRVREYCFSLKSSGFLLAARQVNICASGAPPGPPTILNTYPLTQDGGASRTTTLPSFTSYPVILVEDVRARRTATTIPVLNPHPALLVQNRGASRTTLLSYSTSDPGVPIDPRWTKVNDSVYNITALNNDNEKKHR